MRVKLIIGFQILITVFISAAYLRAQSGGGFVSLSGEITDPSGAVIPQVLILIEGQTNKWEVKTTELGRYHLKLKPGIYKMQVRGPAGFSKIIRGPFKIDQEKQALINFILYSQTSVVKSNEQPTTAALDDMTFSDFTTEEVEFPLADAIKSGVMIFGEKKDAGATVTYSTLSTTDLEGKSGKPGVLLTFNLCSIRADEIVLHKIDWSLEARGNLTIEENGIRRIEKGMIKIKIVGDRLLLEK